MRRMGAEWSNVGRVHGVTSLACPLALLGFSWLNTNSFLRRPSTFDGTTDPSAMFSLFNIVLINALLLGLTIPQRLRHALICIFNLLLNTFPDKRLSLLFLNITLESLVFPVVKINVFWLRNYLDIVYWAVWLSWFTFWWKIRRILEFLFHLYALVGRMSFLAHWGTLSFTINTLFTACLIVS